MAKRRSLRLELIATLTILIMMAAVSLSLAGELLGRRRHEARQQQQLVDHARGLAILVTSLVGSGGAGTARSAEVEHALRPSIGSLGIESVEVHRLLDGGSQPIVTLGLAPALAPPLPADDPEGVVWTAENGRTVVDRPIRTFGPARAQMVLRVVASPAPWASAGDWQEVALLALGIGFVLLVLGVGLVEVQVLRPLAAVRSAVGEVTLGNLQTRVPTEGPAELQSLAESFNQMTEALSDRIEQIGEQREQLVRAQRLAQVGRIAAGTAHEVGNPLAAILGYVELMLDPRTDPPLPEQQRELLERTRGQILRIQGIVGQLLDYSRHSPKALADVDIVAATERLLSLLRHDARCADVELSVDGDKPITGQADPALLEQVIVNLVVNGARAAKDAEGPAQVQLRIRDGDPIEIEVQDSGAGVPDDARPRLFEPFFTTAKPGEGTGLGLAICKDVVEGMGGALKCLRAGAREPLPGARFPGAVFCVTLPRGEGASNHEE